MLRAVAERIGCLKWHVQVNTAPALIAVLKQDFAASPFSIVFDHFGSANAAKGINEPGFDALLSIKDHIYQ